MTDPVSLVFWLAFVGLTAAMLATAALVADARRHARTRVRLMQAAGLTARRAPGGAGGAMPPLHRRAGQQAITLVTRWGERFSAMMGGEAKGIAEDLRSAGFKGRDAVLVYAFVKTVAPLACVLIGGLSVWATSHSLAAMMVPLGTVIALALALSKGVDMALEVIRHKRLTRISAGIPDLLELLVINSEAGIGPQPALQRVSVELVAAHPDLAREVLQMVSEMRMTNDNRTAYAGLSTRIPLPEISIFTQTLDQADIYGTPFSQAMRTLMAELRANRMIRIEEKAARLPVLMTVPLIFCIMPAVFVVLIGPAALSILDNILTGG